MNSLKLEKFSTQMTLALECIADNKFNILNIINDNEGNAIHLILDSMHFKVVENYIDMNL